MFEFPSEEHYLVTESICHYLHLFILLIFNTDFDNERGSRAGCANVKMFTKIKI